MDTNGHQKVNGIYYSRWLVNPHLVSLGLVPQSEILLEMGMISLLFHCQPQVRKKIYEKKNFQRKNKRYCGIQALKSLATNARQNLGYRVLGDISEVHI